MRRINSDIKRRLRTSLCDKFDGKCAYCKRSIGMKGTVDHYLPQALGGTNAQENLRWCCIACNQEKGEMTPEDWELRQPLDYEIETKSDIKAKLLAKIAVKQNHNKRNIWPSQRSSRTH